MSLGCRAYSRSTVLTTRSLLATPRDALTFVYPALHLRHSRASHGTATAQDLVIEQAEGSSRSSLPSCSQPTAGAFAPHKLEATIQPSFGGPENEPKPISCLAELQWTRKERREPACEDRNLTVSTSQQDTLLGPTLAQKVSMGMVQTKGNKEQPTNALTNTIETMTLKEAVQGAKSPLSNSGLSVRFYPVKRKFQRRQSDPSEPLDRKRSLRGPTTESIQETLQLKPTTIRRLVSKAKVKAKWKEDIRDGAVIGETGECVDDWQMALAELKQRYRDDGSDAALGPLGRPYLLPKRPKYREVRAQDIPFPVMWSTSTFAHYIQDLTQSHVSRVNNRYIYNGRLTHVDAVHDILIRVFEDAAMRLYLTPKAFNIAFVYLYKHLKIPSVRRLFNMMSELHMEIPTETFNVLLKGTASRKDLRHLTFMLRYMARQGASPNAESWVALLRAVEDNNAKVVIFKEMRDAGVLKYPATLQNTVMEMLDVELASHITNGQELAPLIEQLDSRYGPNWISLSVVNHLCHRLGENGLVSQAMEVLKLATSRSIKPDTISLHIFLSHSLRLRRPKLAIEIVELFQSRYQIYPDEAAYNVLFMVAFRSQRLQLCRVIWHYACLDGAVSFRMQQIVTRSLVRNTPAEPKSNLQRWMKSAGKAIVAIDFGVNAKEAKPMGNPTGREIMEMLSRYAATVTERKRALRLAMDLVRRDMIASRRYVPRFNLVAMLKSALYWDSQWEDQGKRDKPTMWKVENAMRIPIRVPTTKEINKQVRLEKRRMMLRGSSGHMEGGRLGNHCI